MTGLGARHLDEDPVMQLEVEQDAMEELDVEECFRKVGDDDAEGSRRISPEMDWEIVKIPMLRISL